MNRFTTRCRVLAALLLVGAAPSFGQQLATPRLAAIQDSLLEAENSLEQLVDRVPPRIEDVTRLLDRLNSLPTAQTKPPEPVEPEPRKVSFRPPRMRETAKNPELVIICEDNRSTVVTGAAIQRAYAKGIAPQLRSKPRPSEGRSPIPNSPWELHFRSTGNLVKVRLICPPGTSRQGENAAALSRSGSELRKALSAADPNSDYVQICLYPDSFEVFREVRAIAWEMKYEVRWVPFNPGETINLGAGRGHVD